MIQSSLGITVRPIAPKPLLILVDGSDLIIDQRNALSIQMIDTAQQLAQISYHSRRGGYLPLTPVAKLSSVPPSEKRYQDNTEHNLHLLERFLPFFLDHGVFLLRVEIGVVIFRL